MHRREYVCEKCRQRCPTRHEALAHVREHHGVSVSATQLNIIVDLMERQIDITSTKPELCLFCGEVLPLPNLQEHLAIHMEDISLFVLPSPNEDEEVQDSNASVRVAELGSRRDARNFGSETSSLGFSAAGDNKHTAISFKEILAEMEEGYAARNSSSETTSNDRESIASSDRSWGIWEPADVSYAVWMAVARDWEDEDVGIWGYIFPISWGPPGHGLVLRKRGTDKTIERSGFSQQIISSIPSAVDSYIIGRNPGCGKSI